MIDLRLGDCLEELRAMPDASVDSVVTDPPYGLGKEPKARDVLRAWLDGEEFRPGGAGFMGKSWDAFVPSPLIWAECLRVLKPGGHLVAFAGSRTYDWIVMGVRLAGFEVRDQLIWMYGSGMPKGFNLHRMPDSDFCHCGTGGEPLPSDHGKQKTEHGVRPLRDADLSQAESPGESGGQVLLSRVPQSSTPEPWTPRAEPEVSGEEQPSMEGGRLYGAGEGLPDDPNAETPEGETERLRLGTHPSRRKDARATAGPAGSGSPHQPCARRQPTRELEGLRDAPRALGGASHAGLHRCQGCGRLDASYRGYGGALKPSHEPVVLARKPMSGTVADNVLEHGTGAINVDGCRVGTDGGTKWENQGNAKTPIFGMGGCAPVGIDKGRWPANILHDGSPEVLAVFPDSKPATSRTDTVSQGMFHGGDAGTVYGDTGTAARFYYCAKASRAERELGLDCLEWINLESDAWENEDQKVALLVAMEPSRPVAIGVSGVPETSVSEWNTALFGSESAAPSLTGCKCITSTGISSTTGSRILQWLTLSLTSDSTAVASCSAENGGSRAASAASSSPSITITSGQTVSPLGVVDAASPMRLRVSVDEGRRRGTHPTVKPVSVMRWLVRLVTPPNGTVLDPYSGSGTTGVAAALEGFGFIGCELSPEYVEIARARISHAREFPAMWEPDYQPPDEVPEEQLDLFETKDPNSAK
jgi:DNA modification methylase